MPTVRLPLSWPYNVRGNDTSKGPRRVNVMDEVIGDKVYTTRRPGLSIVEQFTAGQGQGFSFYNGYLYAVIDDVLNSTTTSNSSASGVTWIDGGATSWQPRKNFQLVLCNNVVYVIGGQDSTGAALNDVWSIQVGQGWKLCTAAAPWPARYSFMAGYIGDKIYIIGGIQSGGVQTDVWSSTDGSSWTEETTAFDLGTAPLSAGGLYGAAAISADNGIYLLGGFDSAANEVDCTIFSTDGITWKYANDGSADPWGTGGERTYPNSWYYQSKLWIGGGINGTTPFNDVWYSSDGAKTWTQSTAAAWDSGLFFAGTVVYNNKMWLVNGSDNSALHDDVYSSSDGITWTKVTATGPWKDSYGGQMVVFETLTSISAYHYQTMYWLGGNDGTNMTNHAFYAALNTILSSTTSLSPATSDQMYQMQTFNEGTTLLLKNESGLWVVSGSTVIPVTDPGYPLETVPGIVVLGGFAYVMDPSGLIRNCSLDDPYHWPMLNAIGADYEDDRGVAIAKYLNYLVVFGQYTIQFFYDAGNPVGSPLLPYLSGNMRIGCADANTVVHIGVTLVWLGMTDENSRQVMMFNGLSPQVISDPQIEKIIAGWDVSVSAYGAVSGGHQFYVIYQSSGAALAYDFSTKRWYEWTVAESLAAPLALISSTTVVDNASFQLVLHPTNGAIYFFGNDFANDNGTNYTVLLITDKVDLGNNRNKFFGQTEIIGDRNTGLPLISYSDDDYQSFSNGRVVDMSTARPVLYRNGQGRRRAFQYQQVDENPLRLEAIEVTYEQGL